MKKPFIKHEFIMDTLKRAVEFYPQGQIQEFALKLHLKDELTEDDLATVESWFVEEAE